MGIFDKIKDQALNGINELAGNLQERVNNVQNQQESITPPPSPPQNSPSGGNDGIYGDYMEHLINMALADGELTEKEKQVLFKKAEAAGIDLDEFEMVLDARLYEKQKAMQASQPVSHDSAPKSDKYGDVRKCPSCGAIVESFLTRCPDCGHEFRNIGTTSSFSLLSAKLEALDNKMTGSVWTAYKDLTIIQKKSSLIDGFPIPTTKEDILEFITMATPLAKPATKSRLFSDAKDQYPVAKAWRKKCEQVIMKARFSMKDDKALLDEIEKYAVQLKIK